MRALRLSLVGTVILALLGGLCVAAMAQEESEPSAPAGVLIDLVMLGWDDAETNTATWMFEASDPRLSGTVTVRFNFVDYYPMAGLEALSLRVDNDEGAWTGTGRGIGSAEYGDMQTYILSGEGPYEGLTAFLSVDIAREPNKVKGLIIEGELPSFPEPPVPPAE